MLRFRLNDRPVEVDGAPPWTTLLDWLRDSGRTGTKEGCAEGDCGACSVLLLDPDTEKGPAPRAVNACLVLLPMVHGKHVVTVEGLATPRPGAEPELHPAQRAMVDALGSQCGYCTPGFVCTLAEACHRDDLDDVARFDDHLSGNLCRCTGYRPIRDAAHRVRGSRPDDIVRRSLPSGPALEGLPLPAATSRARSAVDYAGGGGRFVAPSTVADATAFFAEHPSARVVCGGTDLSLDVTKRGAEPTLLLSVDAIPELARVELDGSVLRVGAAAYLTDLEAVAPIPMLKKMLRYFGSRPIKHRATIGGNLVNASPIGDIAPVLLALDAELLLASSAGERRVPIASFFRGYRRTDLRPAELLVRVDIPLPVPVDRTGSYKVSKRRELDISAVAAAFSVRLAHGRIEHVRLAYGGMAATPARAVAAEAALLGSAFDESAVEEACTALATDFRPLSDHRGSAWFRGTVAANLLRGFWEETQASPFVALPDRPHATVLPGAT